MKICFRRLVSYLLVLVNLALPVTNFKVADIQAVDVVLVAILTATAAWLIRQERPVRIDRDISWLLGSWLLFVLLAGLFALCSLRLRFHQPFDALGDPLKTAPFLSAAKLIQLASCMGGFILFAEWLRRDPRLLRFAASAYVWIGVINALCKPQLDAAQPI